MTPSTQPTTSLAQDFTAHYDSAMKYYGYVYRGDTRQQRLEDCLNETRAALNDLEKMLTQPGSTLTASLQTQLTALTKYETWLTAQYPALAQSSNIRSGQSRLSRFSVGLASAKKAYGLISGGDEREEQVNHCHYQAEKAGRALAGMILDGMPFSADMQETYGRLDGIKRVCVDKKSKYGVQASDADPTHLMQTLLTYYLRSEATRKMIEEGKVEPKASEVEKAKFSAQQSPRYRQCQVQAEKGRDAMDKLLEMTRSFKSSAEMDEYYKRLGVTVEEMMNRALNKTIASLSIG